MRDDERDGGPDRSRLLFVLALVLALAATGAVVFTDSALWLRFAVLAALWSAVVGGSIALVYRNRCRERDAEMAELRSRYEQEIDREVTARREHELQVETEIRAEVEQANTEVLHNLRDEVRSLRANVDAMLGGEVMVERIAWHAESTRLRAHQERTQQQAIAQQQAPAQQRRGVQKAPGGQPATVRSAPVEQASPPVRAQPRDVRHPAGATSPPRGELPQRSVEPAGHGHEARGAGTGSGYRAPVADRLARGTTPPAAAPQQPLPPQPPAQQRQQAPNHSQNGLHATAGPAGGRHTQPEMRPAAPEPSPSQPDDPVAGAHAAGTSVTELLAAHGGATGGRRHRRRAE